MSTAEHSGVDRLDWGVRGLSRRTRGVALATLEALLADEDARGHVVPGDAEVCARALDSFDRAVGAGSPDVRRGFAVLSFVLDWLPLFVIGSPSRMSRLPIDRRIHYFEKLESSKSGLLTMLFVAFKVPLTIPAFEEGDELAFTGFDRPTTVSRRRLPVATAAKSFEESSAEP